MAGDGGDEDMDFYRTLASDELQVEVLPALGGGRKRSRVEAALDGDGELDGEASASALPPPGADPVVNSDDEDDHVQVVLCDPGPNSGRMAYYLERKWEKRPALTDAEVGGATVLDSQTGAIVPLDGGMSSSSLSLRPSGGDGVEDVEATLSRIEFHMDFGEMADTPWRQVGANLQDHFNFDLDERGWKDYLLRQVRIRLEAQRNSRASSL
mmetsp:Transcript_132201/g.329680  ORF Transcript_132201/g.329680 Transcript_132201/m.329680 type:complete len:211 (-) Transcript_132201:107-739(-)